MDLLDGFGTVLTPQNLLYAAIGVTIGTLVGMLPGIGPALTIALLLPVALKLDDPIGTLIMFAGIYYGAMYGGSTTSILLNTPGESASVATSIEGYQMAKRGRARAALATAAIGSFVAAIITTVLLTFVMEPMARLAVTFRASDYFALAVLAMVTRHRGRRRLAGPRPDVARLRPHARAGRHRRADRAGPLHLRRAVAARRHRRRGGHRRAVRDRRDAVHRLAAARRCRPRRRRWSRRAGSRGSAAPTGRARGGRGCAAPRSASRSGRCPPAAPSCRRSCPTCTRSGAPKNRDEFGRGAIEGVAGPEAANNASFSGVLVPLLTLGIPTSATAAVMLAAFSYFDISPGPQLLQNQSTLVWALIASLFVGNVMLLALNLPLIRLWVKVLQIPRPLLYSGILVFATLGVYAVSGNIVDVLIAYAIGVVAMFMRHLDFPIAPAILGLILGPLMETQFRRALLLADGDLSVFVTRPLTLILLLLAVAALALPHLPKLVARVRGRRGERLVLGEED